MQEMSDAVCERLAGYFRLLSEPTRLKILNALKAGPRNVGDITQAIHANQANVSKHLGMLLDAGLVSRRQEGTTAIYTIADPAIFQLCDLVCGQMAQKLEAELALHRSLLNHASQ